MVTKAFKTIPQAMNLVCVPYNSNTTKVGDDETEGSANFFGSFIKQIQVAWTEGNRNFKKSESSNLGECLQIWKTFVPGSDRPDIMKPLFNGTTIVTGSENSQSTAISDAMKRELFSKPKQSPRPSGAKKQLYEPSKLDLSGLFGIEKSEKPWSSSVANFFSELFVAEHNGPLTNPQLKMLRVAPTLRQLTEAKKAFHGTSLFDREVVSPPSNEQSPKSRDHHNKRVAALYHILYFEPRPPAFVGGSRIETQPNKTGWQQFSLTESYSSGLIDDTTKLLNSTAPFKTLTGPAKSSFQSNSSMSITDPFSDSTNQTSSSIPTSPTSPRDQESPYSNASTTSRFRKLSRDQKVSGIDPELDEDIRYLHWRNHWLQIVIEARRFSFRLEDFNEMKRELYRNDDIEFIERWKTIIDIETPDLTPRDDILPRRYYPDSLDFKSWARYFSCALQEMGRQYNSINNTLGIRVAGDPAGYSRATPVKPEVRKRALAVREDGRLSLRENHFSICKSAVQYSIDRLENEFR